MTEFKVLNWIVKAGGVCRQFCIHMWFLSSAGSVECHVGHKSPGLQSNRPHWFAIQFYDSMGSDTHWPSTWKELLRHFLNIPSQSTLYSLKFHPSWLCRLISFLCKKIKVIKQLPWKSERSLSNSKSNDERISFKDACSLLLRCKRRWVTFSVFMLRNFPRINLKKQCIFKAYRLFLKVREFQKVMFWKWKTCCMF